VRRTLALLLKLATCTHCSFILPPRPWLRLMERGGSATGNGSAYSASAVLPLPPTVRTGGRSFRQLRSLITPFQATLCATLSCHALSHTALPTIGVFHPPSFFAIHTLIAFQDHCSCQRNCLQSVPLGAPTSSPRSTQVPS
jgi:hypothetical protein